MSLGWGRSGPGYDRLLRMDVRAVLFLVLCATVASYLVPNLLVHAALTVMLLTVSGAYGQVAPALRLLAVYAVAVAWLFINVHFGIIVPPPMALALVYKLIPVLLVLCLLFAIPSAKLTAGIRQLPIPARIQLTLTVMLRFIPTVASETADIRDAMRVRGLLDSPLAVLRSPLSTFEYAVVPLIFRELKLADEISAAAVVRGIESPCTKHAYYTNRMRMTDVVLMSAALLLAAASIVVPRVLSR